MTGTMHLFDRAQEPDDEPTTTWEDWGRGRGTIWYRLASESHHIAVRVDTTTGTWRASAMLRPNDTHNCAASGEHRTPHAALAELRVELQRLLDGIPDDTGLDAVAAKHGGR